MLVFQVRSSCPPAARQLRMAVHTAVPPPFPKPGRSAASEAHSCSHPPPPGTSWLQGGELATSDFAKLAAMVVIAGAGVSGFAVTAYQERKMAQNLQIMGRWVAFVTGGRGEEW